MPSPVNDHIFALLDDSHPCSPFTITLTHLCYLLSRSHSVNQRHLLTPLLSLFLPLRSTHPSDFSLISTISFMRKKRYILMSDSWYSPLLRNISKEMAQRISCRTLYAVTHITHTFLGNATKNPHSPIHTQKPWKKPLLSSLQLSLPLYSLQT